MFRSSWTSLLWRSLVGVPAGVIAIGIANLILAVSVHESTAPQGSTT